MHTLKRLFFNTLVLGSMSAAAVILPADALACSPPAPGLRSTIPADGAYFPANGIILFDGFDISLDQVTVTIEGTPAMLVDASAAFPTPVAALAARVSPKPMPEQKVTISGTFCAGCAAESFTFTARPDDLVAPEGVTSAHYGVHDYADFKSSGGDCQFDSDLALWVHAQTIPASEEEAPAVLRIEAFADSALTNALASTSYVITANDSAWGYRVTTATLQGTAPTAVCFRLSTKDLSGNDGPMPTVVCNACYTRTEAQGMATGLPPDEPVWGEPDVIKNGPCDFSVGVGGGDPESGSCGCRTAGQSQNSAAWMIAACSALGLARTRKRGRHAGK
ncbi:MAG TPA: hypothetical protein PKA58_23595 [Polyangium sp.]|nr:hypothetical protein [Polyangium sp.]